MIREYLAKALFILSAISGIWAFGVLSYKYDVFPYPQIASAVKTSKQAIDELWARSDPSRSWWYKRIPENTPSVITRLPDRLAPGLLLMVGIKENNEQTIKVVDRQGKTIHKWDVDWWRLWPNPDHLREAERPKTNPGPSPQGVLFMPNGDLVFNYEGLGTMRIDYCSQPVWRLPFRTHHSLTVSASGNFWIPGQIDQLSRQENAPNHEPGFLDFRLLEVSPTGKVLQDISVFDLLRQNGLSGLLYMSAKNNWGTPVDGDTLHLNDVEEFPAGMAEGFFKRGDVLVSLRNINAILVFNKNTKKIRYLNVGSFIRQHDPDFIDGNRISVFDNNNLSPVKNNSLPPQKGLYSRIVIVDARTDTTREFYRGTPKHPFFTNIIGNHQWLSNGNLMVTDSRNGRAFELTPDGQLAWEYINLAAPGFAGLIKDMQNLPERFDKEYFAKMDRRCGTPGSK